MSEGVYAVPDAIEPVVGWRAWYVVQIPSGVRLASVVRQGFVWPTRGELEATCAVIWKGEHHHAPADDCTCGIYAAATPRQVKPYLGGYPFTLRGEPGIWRAVGKVKLWGRVIQGDKGWRAQLAYPHSLILPATSAKHEPLDVRAREDLAAELREAYGVPVVVDVRRSHIKEASVT